MISTFLFLALVFSVSQQMHIESLDHHSTEKNIPKDINDKSEGFNPLNSVETVAKKTCKPCECGKANTMTERIVGGSPTKAHEFPWMVALFIKGRFQCGGSLINNLYVLTAAHCVDSGTKDAYTVRFKEYDRSTTNDTKHFDLKVKKIIIHKDYKKAEADIALLQLEKEIEYDNNLRPVCLGYKDISYANQKGLLLGWGRVGTIKPGSPKLLQTKLSIMSNEECKKKTGPSKKFVTDKVLCAAHPEGGIGACYGDSGSPMHIEEKSPKKVLRIIGITSWNAGFECAKKDKPSVYTRVSKYIGWIKENTADACPCGESL